MKQVTLKPLQHRLQESIGIYFDSDVVLNKIVRRQPGVKWSQTNKCWYLPLNKEAYNKIAFAMRGLAEIDNAALRQHLLEKKKKGMEAESKATKVLPLKIIPHRPNG